MSNSSIPLSTGHFAGIVVLQGAAAISFTWLSLVCIVLLYGRNTFSWILCCGNRLQQIKRKQDQVSQASATDNDIAAYPQQARRQRKQSHTSIHLLSISMFLFSIFQIVLCCIDVSLAGTEYSNGGSVSSSGVLFVRDILDIAHFFLFALLCSLFLFIWLRASITFTMILSSSFNTPKVRKLFDVLRGLVRLVLLFDLLLLGAAVVAFAVLAGLQRFGSLSTTLYSVLNESIGLIVALVVVISMLLIALGLSISLIAVLRHSNKILRQASSVSSSFKSEARKSTVTGEDKPMKQTVHRILKQRFAIIRIILGAVGFAFLLVIMLVGGMLAMGFSHYPALYSHLVKALIDVFLLRVVPSVMLLLVLVSVFWPWDPILLMRCIEKVRAQRPNGSGKSALHLIAKPLGVDDEDDTATTVDSDIFSSPREGTIIAEIAAHVREDVQLSTPTSPTDTPVRTNAIAHQDALIEQFDVAESVECTPIESSVSVLQEGQNPQETAPQDA